MSQKSRNKLSSRGLYKYRTLQSDLSPTELKSVQPGHSAFCTRMLELNWPFGSSGENKATATPGVKQRSDCAACRRESLSALKEGENLVETRLKHVTLQEPPEAVKQKFPEVQNVNGKDSTAALPKWEEIGPSRYDIDKEMKALMDGSLSTKDLKEVKGLASPNTMPALITRAIKENIERSSQARCYFGHLLHDLLEYKIMTIDQYNKGFHPVLEWLDDYALDIPKIWEYLGEIIEPMIEDYGSDPNFLKDLLQPCIHSNAAGRLLSAVLYCAASKLGTVKVRKIWKKSGLKWTDFLLFGTNVSNFIVSNKLEFTVTPLFERLASAEIKKQIDFILTSNASSQYIFDFVVPPHAELAKRRQPGWDSKQKKFISFSSSLTQAVKLHKSENAWKPSAYKPETDASKLSRTEEVYKKVRGVLNKLTPQKLDTLVKQVENLDINTEEKLKGVIDLVFEKAINEPNFSVVYANMCKQLALIKVPLSECEGYVLFRKLLIIKCQREFEQGRSEELERVAKKKQNEEWKGADEAKQLQEVYEEEEQKNRRRQLGKIRFIGELFKLGMLIEPILHECIQMLLYQSDEGSLELECLCCLLMTIGRELVSKKEKKSDDILSKDLMNQYIREMQQIVDKRQTSSRVRFMLQEVIDLKWRDWVPRRHENNPKTIDQIHKEAEKEAQEQQQLLQNMPSTKRLPDCRRKGTPPGPFSGGRGSDHDGGWITTNKSSKGNVSVDTSKLQLMRPTELESIQLGPSSGRGFSNWGRGIIGGNKATSTPDMKPRSAVHSNRYSALADQSFGFNEARRSSQRSAASSRESSQGRSSQMPPPIRKTPSSLKEREHLLETVNRLTRVTPQVQPKAVEQKVPDVPNVNGKDSAATVLKGTELSRDDMEKKVKPLVDEFLHNCDFEEATRCILELASPNTMSMLITEAINQVLERSSQARCLFGQLLRDLLKSKIMNIDQYNKGFHPVLEFVDDYALNIPKIWEYLGEIIEPVIEGHGSNLSFLKDLLQPCINTDAAGRLLSAVLHCAASKRGTIKVGKIWRESGLQWADFLPSDTSVSDFIASNKLEFTVTPIKSKPSAELSSEEIKKQINFMLTSNASNEDIFDRVESNIGEENMFKPTFVRALVTCIFEHIISVTGEPSNVYTVDSDKVKLRFPLMSRYVVGKEDLQLQTLYAAQAVANKLGQPKGLLKQLFDHFYDKGIITEESYKKWVKSTDPAEQEGKGVALASVSSFFTWVKEPEAESSREDDPSS